MKKLKLFLRKLGQVNLVALLMVALLSSNLVAQAATSSDLKSVLEGTTFYDPDSGCDQAGSATAPTGDDADTDQSSSCACSEADSNPDTTLTGSDNAEKTWNFFKSKGLSDAQVAGVMGNMMQEANFDPQRIQGGGDSKNPADAGGGGYGIVQWTPGSKIIGIADNLNITGPIYELSTQLAIVWEEMTGTSPTGRQNMVAGLKKINDAAQAALYFDPNFEGGTDPGGIREIYAQQVFTKYSGQAASDPGSPASDGCGPTDASTSPDCQSAVGVAKILCDAKLYDTVSYVMGGGHSGAAAWHLGCPTIGPSCYLDCSGLVNIAVYDVYKVDLNEFTGSEATDTTNWQHIPFNKLQPGDLIQPGSEHGEHVAVVDHVTGSSIHAFSAHTANAPQPDQVGPSTYTRSSGDLYLHYIGPGS